MAQRSPRKARDCRQAKRGVEFAQVGALAGLLLLDGFDDGIEAAQEVKRGECDSKSL